MAKKIKNTTRIRAWCFTLNNYTEDHLTALRELSCQGMIAGLEVSASGTPHVQGAVYFEHPQRMEGVKRLMKCDKVHLEQMFGDWKSNLKYCSKDENILRNTGTGPAQGTRTDIADFRDAIKAGKRDRELIDSFPEPMAKYPRFTNAVRTAFIDPPTEPPEVIVIWGDSGTGKTRHVESAEPDLYKFSYNNSQDWWDGYIGQEAILFEEFYGNVKYSTMLQYCDRYTMNLPIKGSFTRKAWKRVYFTSNQHPTDWWHNGLRSMVRRITSIYHLRFPEDYVAASLPEDIEIDVKPPASPSPKE